MQRSGARGTRLGKFYLLDRCLLMGGTDAPMVKVHGCGWVCLIVSYGTLSPETDEVVERFVEIVRVGLNTAH